MEKNTTYACRVVRINGEEVDYLSELVVDEECGRLFVVATFAIGIGLPCCHQSTCEGGSCQERSELSRLKKVIEKCRYECRRAMSLRHSLYKNHNVSSLS